MWKGSQAYFTPDYQENAASQFARAYGPQVSTGYRSEAGVWFDTTRPFVDNTLLTLRSRVGYAHDEYSNPRLASSFVGLPASDFAVNGVALPPDLVLASVGAELRFPNGISVGAQLDGEFSDRSTRTAAPDVFGIVGELQRRVVMLMSVISSKHLLKFGAFLALVRHNIKRHNGAFVKRIQASPMHRRYMDK